MQYWNRIAKRVRYIAILNEIERTPSKSGGGLPRKSKEFL